MNKKIIYVGGQYGGQEENKQLIEKAVRYLISKQNPHVGAYISPVHCFGYLYEETEYIEGLNYCLSLLDRCDECILLSNWTESTGAKIEYGYCKGKGIPVRILDINEFAWEV